jgi:hypothetical protein
MYELLRSDMVSPIVLLFDEFERTGTKFLAKIGHHLFTHAHNTWRSSFSAALTTNSSWWT